MVFKRNRRLKSKKNSSTESIIKNSSEEIAKEASVSEVIPIRRQSILRDKPKELSPRVQPSRVSKRKAYNRKYATTKSTRDLSKKINSALLMEHDKSGNCMKTDM